MTTHVLVHGAWGGAHGFRHVRRLLQADGHTVFTPSLTGIGERVHLAGPEVGLDTHVHDLVNHLFHEDLTDIVLLGFSYGGMVVTGAIDQVAERVRHLVYLDAFVPADGQSVLDLTGALPPGIDDDGWRLPPAPRDLDDPSTADWVNARRVAQPVRTFTEPARLGRPLESFPFSRTYVKASAEHPSRDPFIPFGRRYRDDPAWAYHEIATNHMIPENRPGELAAILTTLT